MFSGKNSLEIGLKPSLFKKISLRRAPSRQFFDHPVIVATRRVPYKDIAMDAITKLSCILLE